MKKPVKSCVVSSLEGKAFWQPGVKGNCITVKISPWNVDKTNHTVFMHELPRGGKVGEHAHNENEEIFICLEGEGVIFIDGIENSFKKFDVAYLAPKTMHSIQNIGNDPLKFMVVISPTGLEERLKLMGRAKQDANELPPEGFENPLAKLESHGVVRKS